MDRGRFDTLAQLVSSRPSRRAVLAALLGAALPRQEPDVAVARKKRMTRAEVAGVCYPGTRCNPGKGRNQSGCDFSATTLFRNLDARGANLSRASFAGSDLEGVDLRGANVSGSCFVEASLRNGWLGASVNLRNAIFCGTVMPDGSVNDRDCGRGTACCPVFPDSGGGGGGGGGGEDITCISLGTACKPRHLAPSQPPCCAGFTCSRVEPDGRLGASACRRPDGSLV